MNLMNAVDALTCLRSGKPVEDARITGLLDLRGIDVDGAVRFSNCVFEDAVDASDGHFAHGLQLIDCIFNKGLSLAHARINGPLNLTRTVLKPMDGQVEAPFRDLHVDGCIEATRLHVECDLNLSDLACGAALRLRGCKIGGDLLLGSACIEGEFDLSECESDGLEPAAFTEISGYLQCGSSQIESRVLFIGTHLGAANFEQSHIGGTMLLAPGPHTTAPVTIGVHKGEAYSLSLLGASLHGNLEIRGALLEGHLRVSNAEIRCSLVVVGRPDPVTGKMLPTSLGSGGRGTSLRLSSASIQGALLLSGVNFDGLVVITNTKVGVLEIDASSIKNLRSLSEKRGHHGGQTHVLVLSGLEFGELKLSDHSPAAETLDLLNLAKFDEGVYANVENWLRRTARDDAADEVYRAMRKKETAQRHEGMKRWLYQFLGLLYGYGTRVRVAFSLWFLTLAFSCFMFRDGSSLESVSPPNPVPPNALSSEPDWVDKAGVILRIHLPMAIWFSDAEWKPAPKRFLWILRIDVVAQVILVWNLINVTLIIAAFSGVLKRRGS